MDIEKRKEGIRLCQNNSDNLFNSAELLAANKYYSPAIPLLVLSAEEIIKSFAFCLEIFLGSQSEVKKIIKDSGNKKDDSYLYNHVDKHKLAEALITDLEKISLPVSVVRIFIKGKIGEILSLISLPNGKRSEVKSLLNKFGTFNTLKNQGFYVDKKNDEWQTPLTLDELDYNSNKENINLIREIFSPKIDYIINTSDEDLSLIIKNFNP